MREFFQCPVREAGGGPTLVLSGASGYVGRRLATRVKSEYPNALLKCLVGIDEDEFYLRGVERLVAHRIEPLAVDLISGRGMRGLCSPRLLFHLAANTRTSERDQRVNDLGTETLLCATEPLGPENHVIFTSSVAVLDNRRRFDEPLHSETPIEAPPLSRYGQSKFRAEQCLKARCRDSGFRLSILRLSTVYGAEPRPNSFFDVVQKQLAKKSLASRLNWPGLTSFIHVEDVVQCLLMEANDPPPPGEPRIRLLATESFTLQEVFTLLYQRQGFSIRPVTVPKLVWQFFSLSHRLCRWLQPTLPASAFNYLWRFSLIVNPVFHCDSQATIKAFPQLKPRLMENAIHSICPSLMVLRNRCRFGVEFCRNSIFRLCPIR